MLQQVFPLTHTPQKSDLLSSDPAASVGETTGGSMLRSKRNSVSQVGAADTVRERVRAVRDKAEVNFILMEILGVQETNHQRIRNEG